MHTKMHTHAQIRTHAHIHVYTHSAVMYEDIKMAGTLGADGVAFGCLTAAGEIDMDTCVKLFNVATTHVRAELVGCLVLLCQACASGGGGRRRVGGQPCS